jgi:hypothetical protein
MVKRLVVCEAATSGIYRAFDQEALIAVVYMVREETGFLLQKVFKIRGRKVDAVAMSIEHN